jgi:hypothetical protein
MCKNCGAPVMLLGAVWVHLWNMRPPCYMNDAAGRPLVAEVAQ